MGTSGVGPFANDPAAEFLAEATETPPRAVERALRAVADAPASTYLDVDAGQTAHAAAELVALAFGRTGAEVENAEATEIAAKVKPTEKLRLLALRALERLAGPSSEIASLWKGGAQGAAFAACIDELRTRLVDASSGPRKVARPKAGDVLVVPYESQTLLVQVVAPREIVVFLGTSGANDDPLALAGRLQGTRTPCDTAELPRVGRVVGRAPIRAVFKGKRSYAIEVAAIEKYALVTGAHTGWQWATFEDAREHDLYERCRVARWARYARGEAPPRPRSPEEREAEIRRRSKAAWEKRRAATSPGPFGDPSTTQAVFAGVHEHGADWILEGLEDLAAGRIGGGDQEHNARWSYARLALLALWAGRWPTADVPEALRAQVPPKPDGDLSRFFADARTVLDIAVRRESELRMIWEEAPDGGAAFHAAVAALRKAFSG